MEHDGWTYIFLTGQRKAFHYDVPKDWEDVAYERFDYVECGVWRKRTTDLTDRDREDWVQYHGEPNENFISPGDWEYPEPDCIFVRPKGKRAVGYVITPDDLRLVREELEARANGFRQAYPAPVIVEAAERVEALLA